jgi:TonB family protein
MASVVAMTAALTLWQFPLAAAEQPEKNDGNVVQPQLLTKVMPVYPPEAKAAGIDGMVILEVMLDKTGHPESVKAVEGPKELMQSAVDAVEQWTWSPATHNGEPVSVKSRVQINYTLDKPNQKSEKSADKPAN